MKPAPKKTYSIAEIQDAGWTLGENFPLDFKPGIEPALAAFGVSDDEATNKIRYMDQKTDYTSIEGKREALVSKHEKDSMS